MATDLLSSSVKRIVVETEWLPPIDLTDPLAPLPPGESPFLALFKPKISIYTALSSKPFVAQPYGAPTQNWPLIRNLAIGLGILGVMSVVAPRMVKRRPPPRRALAGLNTRRRKRRR